MGNAKSTVVETGLNRPGYLYLNEAVMAKIKSSIGDDGKGSVDELKFGPLYEQMAEKLFPWCSTLTTRARYFFLVYAVLQLALEKAIPPEKQDTSLSFIEASKIAREKGRTFAAHTRRIEKYLTLSLVIAGQGDGTFGQRKVSRWLNSGVGWMGKNILLSDGRYPNAIYRAACHRFGLFTKGSTNATLIASRLRGDNVFGSDWIRYGSVALSELRGIVDFWERQEKDKKKTLVLAGNIFEQSAEARRFRGFSLSSDEANFLYRKIQIVSPYWNDVSLERLRGIYNEKITFADLQNEFIGAPEHRHLLAASHIDNVTKYWRAHYAEIARHPDLDPNLDKISEALGDIRTSLEWLNRETALDTLNSPWQTTWRASYSSLVADWIKMVEENKKRNLAAALKARAEKIMAERGQGKLPPHKRPLDQRDDDIDIELDVRAATFRFGNADRILADIARSIEHV